MTVKELLLKLKAAIKENPDVNDYQVMTEGWCVGTDNVEVDDALKKICLI